MAQAELELELARLREDLAEFNAQDARAVSVRHSFCLALVR